MPPPQTASPASKPDSNTAVVESGSTPLRKAMAAVFFLVSLPVCVLAFSTIVGLGLDQNLPSQIAILGAVCVIALPVLGLASMLGGSGVSPQIRMKGEGSQKTSVNQNWAHHEVKLG